jgi:sugar phosphate isomerase/epimerase
MYTRRDIAKLALATPLAALGAKIDSKVRGVMIGAQSYSFRALEPVNIDTCLDAYKQCGLGYCELWSGHLEPQGKEEVAAWRKNPPLAELEQIRKKFKDAGVDLYALNYSFRENWSDQEIENGFKIAKALGVGRITASSNVSTAKRVDPFAKKYKIYAGMHNHSRISPNEFATPDDFAAAMNGMSKYIVVNLDIGHFTAAGFDPVKYLDENHDRILTLHLKDRKKNQGANIPFGEGETDIKSVLRLLADKKYSIPAMIEYEYKGTADPISEVKKCYEYCKEVLASVGVPMRVN